MRARVPNPILRLLPAALCLSPLLGCDFQMAFARTAAESTADVMEASSLDLERHPDMELFREGLPSLLLQMEGVHAVSPEKHTHTMELSKMYALYAYAYVEDDYEIAEAAGDFDRSEPIRKRTIRLYLRGRDLGLKVMRDRDSDIDEVLKGDTDHLRRYLKRRFNGEFAGKILFWTAMNWGSAINIGRDDPELIAQLATVKALAERAAAIDPTYYHGAPLALLGALESGLPASLGGNPEEGRALYERAIAVEDRKALILLVQYARTCARAIGDRALYEKLLTEVAQSDVVVDEMRLPNAVAKDRAARYLKTIDTDL